MSRSRPAQLWERRPDESTRAYAAFATYRDLGAGRTLAAVASKHGGRPGGVKRASGRYVKWSARHEWTARARAYDAHQAAVRQSAVEKAEAESAGRWVGRRDEALESQW